MLLAKRRRGTLNWNQEKHSSQNTMMPMNIKLCFRLSGLSIQNQSAQFSCIPLVCKSKLGEQL
jgi:hypothetical protein